MISTRYRLIFLHVPKTAGNSIQTVLLPFSDDHKVLNAVQDGRDRFGLKGKITPRKHATLQEYADRLGQQLGEYRIAIAGRHPFDRAISAYFSPHRWLKQSTDSQARPAEPSWDLGSFRSLLQELTSAKTFLEVDGAVRTPDFVLRHETLRSDFNRMAQALALPVTAADLPHVNQSAMANDMRSRLLADAALRSEAERLFAADMALFGYTPTENVESHPSIGA